MRLDGQFESGTSDIWIYVLITYFDCSCHGSVVKVEVLSFFPWPETCECDLADFLTLLKT